MLPPGNRHSRDPYGGNRAVHGAEDVMLLAAIGETEAQIRCTNRYPCAFDQGIIKGVAEEFRDGLPRLNETGDKCREEDCSIVRVLFGEFVRMFD